CCAAAVRALRAGRVRTESLGRSAIRSARKADSSRPCRGAHRSRLARGAPRHSGRLRRTVVRGGPPARGRRGGGTARGLRRSGRTVGSLTLVVREETLQVSGVRCERCVMRLARVLEGHEGLEAANANLMGVVSLTWDDERTSRDALLEALARGGFIPLEPAPSLAIPVARNECG